MDENIDNLKNWSCAKCSSPIERPDATKQQRNKHHFCSTQCSRSFRKERSGELRDSIARLYLEGKSYREVDKRLGIQTASYHLKGLGLMRSRSEAFINSCPLRFRDIELSPVLVEVIEGNLLGDGSIVKKNNRSGVYSHSSKHREHICWLKDIFEREGVKTSKIYVRPAHVGMNGKAFFKESYSFASEALPSLLALRNKWYAPKKFVPQELVLTPIMLLHWHLGDGTFWHTLKGVAQVRFSSQGFSRSDNEFLITMLSTLGIEARLHKAIGGSGHTLSLRVSSIQRFFDLIGDCPEILLTAYKHKWYRS